jgi:oligopeptide/dipeptide ABC transporter ATP-binding protein
MATTLPQQPAPETGGGPVLEVKDLSVEFPTDDGVVHAVRGVSFALEPGQVLGIVGESGSGKSVTSLAIMGLLPRSAHVRGEVNFRGRNLLKLSDKDQTGIRGKQIAMIFQDPMTSLNPVYTVGWQLQEAILAHQDVGKAKAWTRAVELLDLVGIPNARERAKNYPHEFSGGMRQRAVIAMAMTNDPDVIIADEPTTALDVTVQAQVLDTLARVQENTSAGIVLITHDLGVVAGVADRVLVMYAGKSVEIGETDAIYYDPRMPYTLGLLGSLPRLDAKGDEALTPIRGAPPSLINLPPGCPFSPRCPMSRPNCDSDEPALRPVAGLDHVAACHYAEELAGDVAAAEVFQTTEADAQALEELDHLGSLAEVEAEAKAEQAEERA